MVADLKERIDSLGEDVETAKDSAASVYLGISKHPLRFQS